MWNGTAFSCSNSNNDIQLRHSEFNISGGSCNGGAIEARPIRVTNGCYVSQLTVRVSTSLNNKTIQCTHDSDMGPRLIGNSTLNLVYGKYY